MGLVQEMALEPFLFSIRTVYSQHPCC